MTNRYDSAEGTWEDGEMKHAHRGRLITVEQGESRFSYRIENEESHGEYDTADEAYKAAIDEIDCRMLNDAGG